MATPSVRASGGFLRIDCSHAEDVTPVPFTRLQDESDGGAQKGGERGYLGLNGLDSHDGLKGKGISTQLITEAMGGLLTSLLVLVLNVTYASVVFFKGSVLEPYVPHGISMCLICTALSQLALLGLGCPVPYITVSDSFMAVLFAGMNATLLEQPLASPLATVGVAMALTSLFLSSSYVVIGSARLAKVGQYVPSPVLAGYQASIGWLLLDSCINMAAGCSLLKPQCLVDGQSQLRLAIALSCGIGLYFAQRSTSGLMKVLYMPALVVASVFIFLVVGPLLEEPSEWTMSVPSGQSILTELPDLDLTKVDWLAALNAATLTASTAFLPNLIGKLMQFAALEEKYDVAIDFNLELSKWGFAGLWAVPGLMTPCTSYSASMVAFEAGAKGDIPGVFVVASSVILLFYGISVVSLVPKVIFAVILCTSGFSMMLDNLKSAWSTLKRFEFILVVLHIVLTATIGMLYAVMLGLLFTATIFVVQYSWHSGVLHCTTCQLERSKVARIEDEQLILEQVGASVLIVHLHGMLFFGSASSVEEKVREHMKHLERLELPFNALILDFDRVSAVDSSAVASLMQSRRYIGSAQMLFACATPESLLMLKRGAPPNLAFEHFTTLDLALEYAEDALLQLHYNREQPPSPIIKSSRRAMPRIDEGGTGTNSAPSRFASDTPPTLRSAVSEPSAGQPLSSMTALPLSENTMADGAYDSAVDLSVPTVLTPSEARTVLPPDKLAALRERFERTMVRYDVPGLAELLDYMDIMNVPPNFTLFVYPSEQESGSYLYILDTGFVSTATDVLTLNHKAQDQTMLRHRLAKHGTGAVLGTASFVMPSEHLNIMAISATTNTQCQLFRLPRTRCNLLEKTRPDLVFRLYRLIMVIGERRLQDHRLRLVTAEAFKVTMRPSTHFAQLLMQPEGAADEEEDEEAPAQAPLEPPPPDNASVTDDDAVGPSDSEDGGLGHSFSRSWENFTREESSTRDGPAGHAAHPMSSLAPFQDEWTVSLASEQKHGDAAAGTSGERRHKSSRRSFFRKKDSRRSKSNRWPSSSADGLYASGRSQGLSSLNASCTSLDELDTSVQEVDHAYNSANNSANDSANTSANNSANDAATNAALDANSAAAASAAVACATATATAAALARDPTETPRVPTVTSLTAAALTATSDPTATTATASATLTLPVSAPSACPNAPASYVTSSAFASSVASFTSENSSLSGSEMVDDSRDNSFREDEPRDNVVHREAGAAYPSPPTVRPRCVSRGSPQTMSAFPPLVTDLNDGADHGGLLSPVAENSVGRDERAVAASGGEGVVAAASGGEGVVAAASGGEGVALPDASKTSDQETQPEETKTKSASA